MTNTDKKHMLAAIQHDGNTYYYAIRNRLQDGSNTTHKEQKEYCYIKLCKLFAPCKSCEKAKHDHRHCRLQQCEYCDGMHDYSCCHKLIDALCALWNLNDKFLYIDDHIVEWKVWYKANLDSPYIVAGYAED